MKRIVIVLAGLLLLGSQLACCEFTLPQVPTIEINVPTIEVGEMLERQEEVPLEGAESAAVEIVFGAGELDVEAGAPDQLFSGEFRYNVADWEPEVTYEDGVLTVEQGSTDAEWGVPSGNTRNEWKLAFSPEIPLEMEIKIGAGEGDLDFTGLQLTGLDLGLGAGDFALLFDEPNAAEMDHLILDAGASRLEVFGLGYASPQEIRVQGGVGDIALDFAGPWSRSADVRITSGVGAVTLHLPDDVGVQVKVEGGLSSVEASGLNREGDAYVNDAFGEAEVELHIHVTTGVGSLRLLEISNDS